MTLLPLQGQVVTGGAGASVNLDQFGLSPFSIAGQVIKLTMTVSDPFKIGNLSLFVGTSSLANNIKFRFDTETASSRLAKPGELFTVILQLCEINTVAGSITLSPVGVPSQTSGFTDLRLQVSDNATGPITVELFSVELLAPTVPGGFVSIVFDDCNESIVSRAFPKMESLGFKGTSYVIVDAIGTAGRTTIEGTKALAAAGWEIGGHAFTTAGHSNGFTVLTGQQVDDELSGMHDWLVANFPDQQGGYSLAYPLGKYEDTTDGVAIESLVEANGFTSARTILSDVGVSTHTQVESLPSAMPFRMNGMSGISSLTVGQHNPGNLVATGGMLDKVANNGGWMILVFHILVADTPAATTEIAQADFDLIMDAIAERNLTVLPVRDTLRFTSSELGGVTNLYRVQGATASILPTIDRVWIKSVSRPFLNRPVFLQDYSDIGRRAENGIFKVKGRSLPVAVTDVRGSREFEISVLTQTPTEENDLDLIVASGDPVFVHCPPDCPFPTIYAAIGDTTEARSTRLSPLRLFRLPLTEIAPPGVDVVGSTVTWQNIINAYPTWAELIADNATWQDVLENVGQPADVIVP